MEIVECNDAIEPPLQSESESESELLALHWMPCHCMVT